MINEANINRLLDRLGQALPDLVAVYLFGSLATGSGRRDSDIDLAVLCAGRIEAVALWNLAQELASLAARDVDLIDLRAASTVMRARIVAEGRLLRCTDETARAEFEDHAYSAYARFNEERRDILRSIQERGYIAHGG
jgi:uncharacterized protein